MLNVKNSELPPDEYLFDPTKDTDNHEYFLYRTLANLTKGQVAAPCWAADAECFLYRTQRAQRAQKASCFALAASG